jgi:L-2-hydroxyglutarate oxidase LhgO
VAASTTADVVVVGAGIVGLATAYRLLEARPGLRLQVVDAADAVAAHQSSHNSGVLHAGVYYPPGSLKATLCRRGKGQLEAFAAAHDVPVERNGKVIVALDRSELGRLDDLERRARANGVPGLRRLGGDAIRDLEPHVAGIAGLHSPSTGVTDFAAVSQAMADEISGRGAEIVFGARVEALTARDDRVRVTTSSHHLEATTVVTCAGLQSDRVAAMTGDRDGMRIVPFRGTWSLLGPAAVDLIRGNVYPVPDPRYPFLGVHLTRRLDGSVWVGPNAVLAGGRHAYRRGQVDFGDVRDFLTHPGFWRMAAGNVVAGAREVFFDRSRRAYAAQVARYVPEVTADDLVPGPSGVRAQLVGRDGAMVDDFVVSGTGRIVHVRNAPSPAATASLAIGELIRDEVLARL